MIFTLDGIHGLRSDYVRPWIRGLNFSLRAWHGLRRLRPPAGQLFAASTASAQRTASLQPTASSISQRASTRSAGLPVIRERCGESIRDAEFRFYDPAIASALARATEALLPHRANSSSQSAISAEISWSGWSRNRSKLSRRSEERSFLSNGTP